MDENVVTLELPQRDEPQGLTGFEAAKGKCSMLLSARGEGCPWNCVAWWSWEQGGSRSSLQTGDKSRNEFGMLMGQGGS